MFCPHGHVDVSACPECSRLSNVKPFKRITSVPFTKLEVEQSSVVPLDDSKQDDNGKEISIETLRVKRLLVDEGSETLYPTNSGYLHVRLKQIDFLASEKTSPTDVVEQRVHEIRKREARRSPSEQ